MTVRSDDGGGGELNEGDMQELRRVLSRRAPIQSTPRNPMDPIEWTVRKLVPIPETYFWDYHDESLPPEWRHQLPWTLKAWHRTIGAADSALRWTDRWIAQPVADAMGLTAPRMAYVTDHMTEEEWQAARQRLRAQQQRVLRDSEQGVVVTTMDGRPVEPKLEMESNEIPVEDR